MRPPSVVLADAPLGVGMVASAVQCGPPGTTGDALGAGAAALLDGAALLVEGAAALVGGATAVVAAGALLGALAVFFELEQPARAIAATTASVKAVLLGAIDLRFLRRDRKSV